jgi:flagellar hook-basal body complex protein FliE
MSIAKAAGQISNQASQISLGDVERQLRTMRSKANGTEGESSVNESNFFAMLKDGLKDVNSTVKESEKATVDMAAGKPVNLHETMLAVTKAELALNLTVQMRNKIVEAYQEVMRMQV